MAGLRLFAILLLALLIAAAAPLANANAAQDCDAGTAFPTSAAWIMPSGRTYSYFLPGHYFATILAGGPVDVTLFQEPCAIDATCHLHGAVGLVTCSTERVATIEIHNPGPGTVPLYLAIGQCTALRLCEAV